MGAPLNLTGQKINHLLVIEKTKERDASGGIKWLCQCDCGKTALVSASRLKTGKAKSCGCLSEAALLKGRGHNFKDLTGQKFGKLTVLERVDNMILSSGVPKVQYKCQCDCGNITYVLADNLRRENSRSCGLCNENSHGNLKIDTLLTQANIPFIREYRFNDCRDTLPLPFDFYVNNSYLIEFDGKQHFETGGNWGDIDYDTILKHDKIKNDYCKTHNIPLIRIPYYQLEKMTLDDLLLSTSKFILN